MANCGRQRVVQAAAVVHARQGIGADFREGHQIGALVPQGVVGVGDLRGQLQGGLEDLFGLATKIFPGLLLRLLAQLADAFAELVHAGVVRGQALAQFPGDFLQLAGHRLGPPQLALAADDRLIARAAAPPAKDVADRGDRRQGHRDGNIHGPQIQHRHEWFPLRSLRYCPKPRAKHRHRPNVRRARCAAGPAGRHRQPRDPGVLTRLPH